MVESNFQSQIEAIKKVFSTKGLHFALCGVVAGEGLFALGLPEYLRDSDAVLRQVKIPSAVKKVLASVWRELEARGVMERDEALKRSLFCDRIEKILKAHALLDDRLVVSLDDCFLIEEAPWGTESERSVVREVVAKVLDANASDKITEFYDEQGCETVTCWECVAPDGTTCFIEIEPRSLDLDGSAKYFRRVYDEKKRFGHFADSLVREGDAISYYDAASSMTRDYRICKEALELNEDVPDAESTRRLLESVTKELSKETEMLRHMSDELLVTGQ